jgi:hypothetical protein
MTYNFDPERWYENELAVLVRQRDAGGMDAEAFRAAEADLDRRYEKMLDRLDGTYRIPVSRRDQGP